MRNVPFSNISNRLSHFQSTHLRSNLYLSTIALPIEPIELTTQLQILGLEAELFRVRVTLARWRDWLQSSKVASTLVKNLVLRRALVLEVDQSGIGAADGSGAEMVIGCRLCTLLLRRRRKRRVILEVEPVIAVNVGKNIL